MDEEQSRTDELQTGLQEAAQPAAEKKKGRTKRVLEMDNRRAIIFTVAGVYLLYLAFKILTGIIGGAEGSVLVTHVIPIAASVLFVVAGIWLLSLCVRAFLAQAKQQKEEETGRKE